MNNSYKVLLFTLFLGVLSFSQNLYASYLDDIYLDDYDGLFILQFQNEKCVSPQHDPLFETEGELATTEVCYSFTSDNQIQRCLINPEAKVESCQNITPLSVAGQVLTDTDKIEQFQLFLLDLSNSDELDLSEADEDLIQDIQGVLGGLRFASSQRENITSGIDDLLSLDEIDFEQSNIDTNRQLLLGGVDFIGGIMVARITSGLAYRLGPVPGTGKIVVAAPTNRGLILRTLGGGVKLTKSLLSITGWLRRISKVTILYAVASPALRYWKVKNNEDPGIAPVVSTAKIGIDYIKSIELPDGITSIRRPELEDTSN